VGLVKKNPFFYKNRVPPDTWNLDCPEESIYAVDFVNIPDSRKLRAWFHITIPGIAVSKPHKSYCRYIVDSCRTVRIMVPSLIAFVVSLLL
jgi:hypothetical protein